MIGLRIGKTHVADVLLDDTYTIGFLKKRMGKWTELCSWQKPDVIFARLAARYR